MNAKLNAIAEKAAADLLALIQEDERKILDAWNECEEEAQNNETKPKFKLGLSITLDLDKDGMETTLSFGIKHKRTMQCAIPDPNQPELLEKN